jgi:hypothetical protein
MGPREEQRGPATGQAPKRSDTAKHQIGDSVAGERVSDRQRRISRLADQLMPMAVHYGPRPLRAVPLSQFLVEGWWTA